MNSKLFFNGVGLIQFGRKLFDAVRLKNDPLRFRARIRGRRSKGSMVRNYEKTIESAEMAACHGEPSLQWWFQISEFRISTI